MSTSHMEFPPAIELNFTSKSQAHRKQNRPPSDPYSLPTKWAETTVVKQGCHKGKSSITTASGKKTESPGLK